MALLFSRSSRSQWPRGRRLRNTHLELELLEDRSVPSAGYQQLNLTGFQPGMGHFTDPNLNGWGMDLAPDGSFVVANTFSTGLATSYDSQGKPLPQTITVPPAPSQPFGPVGHPTGVVYNPTSDFVISANGKLAPATFLFDTFDGTISGWNPTVDPTHAVLVVDNSTESPHPAVYTGLTIAQNSQGQNVLYAADFGLGASNSNNRIDMFDGSFHSLGSFTDPNVAGQYPGSTAFQVENVNNRLWVTYGTLTPPYGGVVDIFDTDGHLLTPNHFAANTPGAGPLQNPWAVVQAPANFGTFSNDILIGNVEGAGNINAFDPVTGAYLGQLQHPDATPIAIPGLWDLVLVGRGNGNGNGNTSQLYFDAGPNGPNPAGNGLFGRIFLAGPPSQPQATNPGNTAAVSTKASAPSDAVFGGQRVQSATLPSPGSVLQNRAVAGTPLTLGSSSQSAVALAAAPGGKYQPPGPATSWELVTGLTHRRVLDQVFATLDSGSLWYASQGDVISPWVL
jgi:uncharacterized protein (TIGR03118 family)